MTFPWAIEDKAKRKSALIYLFLCIFLGIFGVHRFYKRQIGMGFLYLFTVGLFFVGWISDIVKAFTGNIPDADADKNAILAIAPNFIFSKTTRLQKYSFYIDSVNKQWALEFKHKVKIYKFGDVLDFKVEENGSSIMQGKTGGTIIGGVAFGAAGAVIGSAGKRRIKETCDSLLLRIFINDLQNSMIVIPYITHSVPKGYGVYSNSMSKIGEVTSILTYMQKNSTSSPVSAG